MPNIHRGTKNISKEKKKKTAQGWGKDAHFIGFNKTEIFCFLFEKSTLDSLAKLESKEPMGVHWGLE